MKVVRRDRFELSLSDYKSPVLTTELSEHMFFVCPNVKRLSALSIIFEITTLVRVTRLELARDTPIGA